MNVGKVGTSHETIVLAVQSAICAARPSIDPTEIRPATILWGVPDAEGSDHEMSENCLDLDSLDILEVVFSLEENLGMLLPEEFDYGSLITVDDLASALFRSQFSANDQPNGGEF